MGKITLKLGFLRRVSQFFIFLFFLKKKHFDHPLKINLLPPKLGYENR